MLKTHIFVIIMRVRLCMWIFFLYFCSAKGMANTIIIHLNNKFQNTNNSYVVKRFIYRP